jgi:hypothetical protein
MLTYDDQGRAFWNGERIPRVTEICSLLAPRYFTDEYFLNRGRIIHQITEWEDTGELDESTVDLNLSGYLEAYRAFKQATGWKTLLSEIKFFHEKYRYCGRADRIGFFHNPKWKWTLDIKSGQSHEADELQAPAYLFGLRSSGSLTQKCGDLYLRPNRTYRFSEVKNPTEKFLKFLTGLKEWKRLNHEQNDKN